MSGTQTGDVYSRQVSLAEWYEKAGIGNLALVRAEDSTKTDRLKILNSVIGLPYNAPYMLSLTDVFQATPKLAEVITLFGGRPCGLRANPTDTTLPRHRIRGLGLKESVDWLRSQVSASAPYEVEVVPHVEEPEWSTIFVVTTRSFVGEIVRGGHHYLTQSVSTPTDIIRFKRVNDEWILSRSDTEATTHLETIRIAVRVVDDRRRAELTRELDAEFDGDYLIGYFETICSSSWGLRFVDYNRRIAKLFADPSSPRLDEAFPYIYANEANQLSGVPASPGSWSGVAKILLDPDGPNLEFSAGDVLVCAATTPDYIPLIQLAGAVVTDSGGMLSHAAIVCRELRKPCVAGVKVGTHVINHGDRVHVDGTRGSVSIQAPISRAPALTEESSSATLTRSGPDAVRKS